MRTSQNIRGGGLQLLETYCRAIMLGASEYDENGYDAMQSAEGKMTMIDHFVRHLLQSGEQACVDFECRAAEDASCRTVCKTCIIDESRECCQCEYQEPERVPNLVHGQQCNYLLWMDSAAEESYDGADAPVRGPDWQPVTFAWEGDYYTWDYAESADAIDGIADLISELRRRDESATAVIERLKAENEQLRRGGEELGNIVRRQCQDVLNITGLHHLIGADGDGDWAAVWENLAEMAEAGKAAMK